MKLTLEGISDRKEWEQKGYKLPEYHIERTPKVSHSGFISEQEICFVHFMPV